jgi:Flp pilus assembly protein TadD
VLLNNLAVTEAQAANYSGAHTLLQRAARLAPKNIVIADNLAQLNEFLEVRRLRGEQAKAAVDARPQAVLPAPPALWAASSPNTARATR